MAARLRTVDLPTATASASYDGSSLAGWTPDSADALVVEDGVLRQAVLSNVKGGQWYLPSPAVWDAGEINGDYVINATMAADVRMIKDEEAGSYPGWIVELWCFPCSSVYRWQHPVGLYSGQVMQLGRKLFRVWSTVSAINSAILSPWFLAITIHEGCFRVFPIRVSSETVYAMRDVQDRPVSGGVVTVMAGR